MRISELIGKKICVLGGTGVIGIYVVEYLLKQGAVVDVCTRQKRKLYFNSANYFEGDFLDLQTVREFFRDKKYDAIIDFMTYNTAKFAERYEVLLKSTCHYVFMSSYRVYSDKELPIKESSPRLLEVATEKEFLESDDYSLFKAREENILRSSKFINWTILRPAITYSRQRIAFVTLELPLMLRRSQKQKPIYIPDDVLNVEATCTWAGDVAKMIVSLVLNENAYGEIFSVCTSEHQTWGTIANYYHDLIKADIQPIPTEDYLNFFGNKPVNRWQLYYDRCMNRVMDNSKILNITGIEEKDIISLRDGLEKSIKEAAESTSWPEYTNLYDVDKAMDYYTTMR